MDSFVENNPDFFVFVLIHTLISIVLGYILSRYVRRRFIGSSEVIDKKDNERLKEIINESLLYKLLFKVSLHRNNFKSSFLYFMVFIFSMPVLGYIESVILAMMMVKVKYKETESNTNILNMEEFGISFLEVERVFGEGSMNDLMNNEYAPQSKKLRALSVLSENVSPANLKIIRQTLSSRDDEIRMFGYAIIDKAEKRLAHSINHELEHLKEHTQSNNIYKIANSSYKLAFLYWELLYTELLHESFEKEFLKNVENYATKAKTNYLLLMEQNKEKTGSSQEQEDDSFEELEIGSILDEIEEENGLERGHHTLKQIQTGLSKIYFLMGRVYMRRKQHAKALDEFLSARELSHHHSSDYILPYIAEMYYIMKNYTMVASTLSELQGTSTNSTVYPILEQWKRA